MTAFRAGAASLPLEPPLDLPMVGFVRQRYGALGYGIPLEVGAIVLERGDTRVVLCGVDIVGIDAPEIGAADRAGRRRRPGLRRRGSSSTGATRISRRRAAGSTARSSASWTRTAQVAVDAFARVIQDKIVSAAQLAAERLEPARVVWGQGRRRRRRQPPRAN